MSCLDSYFTQYTRAKGLFYFLCGAYLVIVAFIAVFQPLIPTHCTLTPSPSPPSFENPLYNSDPCREVRFAALLFLTREECDFARRIIFATLTGAVIGWERRSADRPAGIRTMALVSLGSCLFTLCSAFAFVSGPMSWDASRVSAAIPSGVGFLGAGLIFKEQTGEVHGLTTAASLWLSAASGIASGGGLYFVVSFSVVVMIIILRFGPKLQKDHEEDEEKGEDIEEGMGEEIVPINQQGPLPSYAAVVTPSRGENVKKRQLKKQAQYVS